ncbi:SAM-dependent methyltransferase, partial [Enterococcus faecalis]
VQFVQGNLLVLCEVGQIQAITFFSDSLCYLANRLEVVQVFDEVYLALDEDGTFVFDVHTTYKIDSDFPEKSYHYQTE